MTRTDKITFWIIEIIIVCCVSWLVWSGWYSHQYCGTSLYENPYLAKEIWLGKVANLLTLIGLGLILTISNVVALYAARFRFFYELSVVCKIIFRVYIFVAIFATIWLLLLLGQPFLDKILLAIV